MRIVVGANLPMIGFVRSLYCDLWLPIFSKQKAIMPSVGETLCQVSKSYSQGTIRPSNLRTFESHKDSVTLGAKANLLKSGFYE